MMYAVIDSLYEASTAAGNSHRRSIQTSHDLASNTHRPVVHRHPVDISDLFIQSDDNDLAMDASGERAARLPIACTIPM